MIILQEMVYLGCQPKQLWYEIFLMKQMGSDWSQNFILEIVYFWRLIRNCDSFRHKSFFPLTLDIMAKNTILILKSTWNNFVLETDKDDHSSRVYIYSGFHKDMNSVWYYMSTKYHFYLSSIIIILSWNFRVTEQPKIKIL